jgi:hypothetical protein
MISKTPFKPKSHDFGYGSVVRWILPVAPMLASLVIAAPLCGQTDTEKNAAEMITPEVDRAIEAGLGLLASGQHADGSIGSGSYHGNAAICALAGLAFLSEGSTPGRGTYGESVQRCVDYLLEITQQSGFITAPGAASHGPMYGHGFATMFLAECNGMSARPELREKLARAVKLIVNTQNTDGGWRYQPQRLDADISVTVCQVMALRAARNCGIHVPRTTIDRSVDYVKRSQNADGGFMYMIHGGESAFPRSAAGVVALYSAGVYEGPEIEKGIQYLMRFKPEPGVVRRETYYFYGHYYAVQAMWQAGGDTWSAWYPAIRDQLIARQEEDGSWISPISSEYATAMACIILQIPNNCVPIFQK